MNGRYSPKEWYVKYAPLRGCSSCSSCSSEHRNSVLRNRRKRKAGAIFVEGFHLEQFILIRTKSKPETEKSLVSHILEEPKAKLNHRIIIT